MPLYNPAGAGSGLSEAEVQALIDTHSADTTNVHGITDTSTLSGSDPAQGSFAPGSFTLATGKYAVMSDRLTLTSTQRATLAGTARLRIT